MNRNRIIAIAVAGMAVLAAGAWALPQQCNLTVWQSSVWELSCPDDGCDDEGICHGHFIGSPSGNQIWCDCMGGGETICETHARLHNGVLTITCYNPCPETCDIDDDIPTSPPGIVPCFCDK